MIFSEQKINDVFVYQVKDVFGEMEITSPDKLDAGKLDDVFMSVFTAHAKDGAGKIEGIVKDTKINYKYIKKNQWDKIKEQKTRR